MTAIETLKQQVCAKIDERREEIIAIGERIAREPELGFKEVKTARLVAETFARLGIPYRDGLAVTGVRGELACGAPGPTVALMGELDAVIVPDHPLADPATGAAHACGHHAQIAGMLGAAMGLADTPVLRELAGRVALFAVPAEEYVELEYRQQLMRDGIIEFLGGKPELIRLGEFDDIDLALLIHTGMGATATVTKTQNGCIAKLIRYRGKAAHAGGSPHAGINALNAATLALSAIHAQRETFREDEVVRVHPIITKGGDVVNVVPADVRLETFVRAKTVQAIAEANRKVDRALKAGAMAMGAQVTIRTLPGYLPMTNHLELAEMFKANVLPLIPEDSFNIREHGAASTDVGDLTHLLPTLHPSIGGVTGTGHGADYLVTDPELAYVTPAKVLAMMTIDLLADNAARAREITDAFTPPMTRDAYLEYQRNLNTEETVDYSDSATAPV